MFFQDRVSLYCPSCPGTHFVDQAGLELKNLAVSASQVLGLKACATTAWLCSYLLRRQMFLLLLSLDCLFVCLPSAMISKFHMPHSGNSVRKATSCTRRCSIGRKELQCQESFIGIMDSVLYPHFGGFICEYITYFLTTMIIGICDKKSENLFWLIVKV